MQAIFPISQANYQDEDPGLLIVNSTLTEHGFPDYAFYYGIHNLQYLNTNPIILCLIGVCYIFPKLKKIFLNSNFTTSSFFVYY